NGTVHWRNDVGIVEIELGTFHERLIQLYCRRVLVDDVCLVLGLLPRDRVLSGELLIAHEIRAVLVEHSLIAQKLAGILIKYRLIRAWIDLGADLIRSHLCVVVAVKILNYARDVGPDNDREYGIDGSRGGRRAGDGAARGRYCDVMHGSGAMRAPPCQCGGCGNDKQSNHDPAATDMDPLPPGLCCCRWG